MSKRTERSRSPDKSLAGDGGGSLASEEGEGESDTNRPDTRALADVAHTDNEGVMMPSEVDAVEESHHELLANDGFTFNRATGQYEYDLLIPDRLGERFETTNLHEFFNQKSEVDRLTKEDDGYHLKGTAPRPEIGHFLLTVVEKSEALLKQ